MKAIILRETGAPENLKLEEVPDPRAGAGEVVVKLKAAALNHRDVWILKGQYAGIKLPIILGSDGAGTIAEVGEGIDKSWISREVVINPSLDWGPDDRAQQAKFRILGLPDDGTFAELVKVPATNINPKPASLTFEEAAAIPLGGLTAYRAVVTRAQVKAGETVVVTGVGGGVATFAVQICKHLGARVLVTSGSDEKIEQAKKLGADGGVNYKTEGWAKKLLEHNSGEGPDVVIDSAGGESLEKAVEIAKPAGRIVFFGATTGLAKNIDLRRIFWKQLNLLGTTMGTAFEFGAMLELFNRGLKPVVDKVFPLAEAAAAHRRMEEAGQFGKIVLKIE